MHTPCRIPLMLLLTAITLLPNNAFSWDWPEWPFHYNNHNDDLSARIKAQKKAQSPTPNLFESSPFQEARQANNPLHATNFPDNAAANEGAQLLGGFIQPAKQIRNFFAPHISALDEIRHRIWVVLSFKPPVGAVAALILLNRMFGSNALNNVLQPEVAERTEERQRRMKMRRRRHRRGRRSNDLDDSDRSYDMFGGVESVRAEMCVKSLEEYLDQEPLGEEDFEPEEEEIMLGNRTAQLAQQPPAPNRFEWRFRNVGVQSRALPSEKEADEDEEENPSEKKNSPWEWRFRNFPEEEDYLHKRRRSRGLPGVSHNAMLHHLASVAMNALKVTCPPRGSREVFVYRMAEPLALLQPALDHTFEWNTTNTTSTTMGATPLILISKAAKVAEVRTLDALLRTLRDRLLVTTTRLRRAEKHWANRLKYHEGGTLRLILLLFRKITLRAASLKDVRKNLAFASAAYTREKELLGAVQGTLMDRPSDLKMEVLLDWVDAQGREEKKREEKEKKMGVAGGVKREVIKLWAKVRRKKDVDTPVVEEQSENAASGNTTSPDDETTAATFATTNLLNQDASWMTQANAWTLQARTVICNALYDKMAGLSEDEIVSLDTRRNVTVAEEITLLQQWCAGKRVSEVQGMSITSEEEEEEEEAWKAILGMVDGMAMTRRVGEKKYFSTQDLKVWMKRYDVLGVPSAMATMGAALVVHNTVKPHWETIVEAANVAWKAFFGIVEFRFYNPVKDIVLDLLNRRPRMIEKYALINEQNSLDNMLRDLGVGDGTVDNRPEAVASASRMYEEELRVGTVRGLVRGRIVRLLLIQVQQLKAELLKAMDTIDDLVDANRLNVQILASIPAVLFLTVSTKVFFSSLYSFRTADIRPIQNVHGEMTDYLNRLERCLLLANHERDETIEIISKDQEDLSGNTTSDATGQSDESVAVSVTNPPDYLQSSELGEFVLLIYSYLVMLDYGSPPFPRSKCDSIHSSMQDLLLQGHLSTEKQMDLLQSIKSQHDALLKV